MTAAQTARVTWTVASIFVVETVTFGLAVLPAFLFWSWCLTWLPEPWPLLRPAAVAMSLVPAYLVFAFALALLSAWGRACWAGVRRLRESGSCGIWNGLC